MDPWKRPQKNQASPGRVLEILPPNHAATLKASKKSRKVELTDVEKKIDVLLSEVGHGVPRPCKTHCALSTFSYLKSLDERSSCFHFARDRTFETVARLGGGLGMTSLATVILSMPSIIIGPHMFPVAGVGVAAGMASSWCHGNRVDGEHPLHDALSHYVSLMRMARRVFGSAPTGIRKRRLTLRA